MSLLSDFGSFLPDTILVHPVTIDAYGTPTLGTPTPYLGRITAKTQTSRNDRGEERVTSFTVQLATTSDTDVAPSSRLALANGTVEYVFSVATFRDENNVHHHTTVTF